MSYLNAKTPFESRSTARDFRRASLSLLVLTVNLALISALRISHRSLEAKTRPQVQGADHMQSTLTYAGSFSSPSNINFKYYDNLQAEKANYFYGSMTKEAYEMRVKLYKLDDYEQCNAETPFATPDMQQCIACPEDKPLFDLGLRKCEVCRLHLNEKCDAIIAETHPEMLPAQDSQPSAQNNTSALNQTQTQADVSVNVSVSPGVGSSNSSNSAVDQNVEVKSESEPSESQNAESSESETASPIERSTDRNSPHVVFWTPGRAAESKESQESVGQNSTDQESFVLEPTPVAPFEIESNQSSQANELTQNSNYNGPQYRVFRNSSSAQRPDSSNYSDVASSQRKKVAGVFQSACPAQAPFYNSELERCEPCDPGTEFVAASKKCEQIIYASNPANKYLIMESNDQMLRRNEEVRKAHPGRTVRTCPLSQPIARDGVCFGCPGDKIYNMAIDQCQSGCPEGQIFNLAGSRCIQADFVTNPEAPFLLSPINDFEEFRKRQELKIQSSTTTLKCPIVTPFFIEGECQNCPVDNPYFNIESEQCEGCSRGRFYHPEERRCLSDYDTSIEVKRMVPNII